MIRSATAVSFAEGAAATTSVVTLVTKAKDGDKWAFERLMRMFQGEIFRMVYHRIRSPWDAEDVTQDVFLLAYKNLPSLKEADRFRCWIFRIAINRARDHNRRKRLLALFEPLADHESEKELPDRNTDDRQCMDAIDRETFWREVGSFLKKLSRMEREVFTLRFVDHLNIREISEVLGSGESAIKTHLYRALAKFRKNPSMTRWVEEQ
jgi:RNA polymerase sigma-70 factor (ECF subfamily)